MLATNAQRAQLVNLFLRQGRQQTYRKGEFIIRPGEPPPGVFYIDKGLVKAYDITKYGEENLLIIRKNHEIFPLIWAVTGQERSIIYEALASTVTFQIAQEKFLNYIRTNTDALAPLLDMTIEMYRLHSEHILNLEHRTVRQRLISYLLNMSERFGQPAERGILLEVPLRHQDIASSINASRETTSREIGALEKKQLLSSKQSLILLKEPDKLRSYLV